MDHDATQLSATDDTTAPAAHVAVEHEETAVDELLIEEISIDGMCGVY